MGSPPPDFPGANAPAEPGLPERLGDVPRPERSDIVTPVPVSGLRPERPDVYLRREPRGYQVRDPLWRYIVLFLLTLLTTTAAGAGHYASYYVGFSQVELPFTWVELLVRGLWYSIPVLAILGTHEMGHYLACKYYGVDASRPYFLPMPILLTGTLGAFIRIRQPIPNKRQLFDIGIAGPIAGFLVAVPMLFAGMYLSRIIELPKEFQGPVVWLGEPLLFKAAQWLTFGSVPAGFSLNMHPVAFAAWFGLLATALNLFPIGQLDGGHISYAVLGPKSTVVTIVMIGCLVGLTFWSLSWAVWAGLMIVMLFAFGPRHPRTPDEDVPLDAMRKGLAVFAVVMFVLCFTPVPMELLDLVTPP
jgi:membrane-associated protease RseP (regulator of RpoE activity)